jgi:hypothetical protein
VRLFDEEYSPLLFYIRNHVFFTNTDAMWDH